MIYSRAVVSVISRLTEQFARFPGIGPRQAKRFVYFLLTRDHRFLDDLSRLIVELKQEVHHCSACYRFFTGREQQFCDICSDPSRNSALLMIVEKDVDFENIERSGVYDGLYFILGGAVPVLEKEPEKRIRSAPLTERIKRDLDSGKLKEIIFALSANTEGDNTERFLLALIKPLTENKDVKISHLGRGLSTGTELEYSDSETIKNALRNRS